MPERTQSIQRVIAKTINEKTFGDPDKVAADIIAALPKSASG